jgi:hypothetical protein
MPAGLTVTEILERVPNLPKHFSEYGQVVINDEILPKFLWSKVPKEGAQVVLSIRLQGNVGKGLKNVLAIVAQIALIAAASLISGGALAPILGASFAAGTVGASLAAAGIGLLGTVLIGALFKQRQPQSQNQDSGIAPGNATLSGNILPPNGRMPRTLGTRRVFPSVVSPPLTEVVGDVEYVECVYGLAGPHALTDIQIGGSTIDGMPDVSVETRQGVYDDEAISLVTRQGFEQYPQITMTDFQLSKVSGHTNVVLNQNDPESCMPQWHRVTTRTNPDEFWITIIWPEGLFDDDDPTQARSQPIRIRFRQAGQTTWINGPEIHWRARKPRLLRKMIKFMWKTTPSPLPTPPSDEGPVLAFIEVPAQTATPTNRPGWQSDAYFDNGSGLTNSKNIGQYLDRVELYLDPATFPKGKYEIELIHGLSHKVTLFNATTYVYNSDQVFDFFGYILDSGTYKLERDYAGEHTTVQIYRTASVWNENPLPLLGEDAVMALKAKNRSITDFSVLATALVPDWDGTEWSGLVASSNPATILRDVLSGVFTPLPVPTALLDNTALLAWRQFCIDNNLQIAAVSDSSSGGDCVAQCVACGFAILRASDTWGVAWEHDRSLESPDQIFSPRNSANFSWKITFDRRPDGLIVSYRDANGDTQQITVLDDGVEFPQRLNEVTYDFIDNEDAATELAHRDLRLARLRNVAYSLDTDVESLVCQRGSLVGVQHDVIEKQAGYAYIDEVIYDDPETKENIVGLVLDNAIPIIEGIANFNDIVDVNDVLDVNSLEGSTGIAIRCTDQSTLLKTLGGITATTNTITFDEPFPDPGNIEPGLLLVSGPLGSEYKRMIVFAVDPGEDLTATLTLLDEAPELYA